MLHASWSPPNPTRAGPHGTIGTRTRLTRMHDDIAHLGLMEDDAIQLDASALELAGLDHPGTDIETYVTLLDELTRRIVAIGEDARSATDRAAVLARVIAHEYGFSGDRDAYDDPDNADLIRVIDRRRGLPVSLSILYVAAARRLGWSADALNTPGHVLIRLGPDTAPVLVDPFDDGRIVTPGQLTTLLHRVLGGHGQPTNEHVAAMSNREVLVRLLMNQATRAEAGGDPARALALYERMTVIAPATGHAWWQRSRLELAGGHISAARASLSAMLEMTRDPAVRTTIAATLDSLAAWRS